jgi:hypothetical protein
MGIEMQRGYQETRWKMRGFSGGIQPTVSVDPTKMFASSEKAIPAIEHRHYGNFFQFNVSPTSFDLDPYFFFQKNDYALTVRAGNAKDMNHSKEPLASGNSHSVQAMVYKGPLYLSGWGYDICGLPVPCSGVSNETRIFNKDTPVDRRLWKTGPVDLRWDDDRKVWTGGPEVVEGKMLTTLPPGNFDGASVGTGIVYRGKNLKFSTFDIQENKSGLIKPDPNGESYVSKKDNLELITIYNRNSKISLASGDYFSAMKINYEWRIMGAGGGGGSCVVGKFKKMNCSSANVPKTAVPDFIIRKRLDSQNQGIYEVKFTNLGAKRVYYFQTDQLFLKDLIPSDAAGGRLANSNGIIDITESINKVSVAYSGYFSLVAFNNCEMSSDVFTYKFPNSGQYADIGSTLPDGTVSIGAYQMVYQKPLSKLFDCPESDDNFGTVTDDQTGAEFYAMHPFKYLKHNVRVVACASNLKVICNQKSYSAYVITEVDEAANAGTSLTRE